VLETYKPVRIDIFFFSPYQYFLIHITYMDSRDSVVDIATGYGAGRPRGQSSSPGTVKNCLFSTSSWSALGPTQPPIQWVWGGGALSPGVKLQGHEADHSAPASAEVKKMWDYTSTPPYAFMA
jgi:hypothetical protein